MSPSVARGSLLKAGPTRATNQRGVQCREGHQARPCPNCCSLSCFSPKRTRAAIPLPPLTTSHHHGDQHSAQDPNKWKTVLSPCHSLIFSFSLLFISSLSLPLCVSLIPTVSPVSFFFSTFTFVPVFFPPPSASHLSSLLHYASAFIPSPFTSNLSQNPKC